MRTQKFGIEIEMTGITRERAAQVIAGYFGTTSSYRGGVYGAYEAADRQGVSGKWYQMHPSLARERLPQGVRAWQGAIIPVK